MTTPRTILLAALLALGARVCGATYYVDVANPAASDANPGTLASPWKTIQKAANAAHPGDTCLVAPGSYPERVTCRVGGTASAKIVLKGASRRTATTLGFAVTADYVRVEGFRVGRTHLGYGSAIDVSGTHAEIVDDYVEYSEHFGIGSSGAGCLISGNTVYGCGSGILSGADDALVEDNEVERLIFAGFDDADYSRGWGTNVTFRRNYFHGTRWADINSNQPHIDGFQTFFGGLRNFLFEDNWLESFHEGLMLEGSSSAPDSTRDFIIRNNVMIGYAEDIDSAWGVCTKDGTYVRNVQVYGNLMKDIHWFGAGIGTTCTGSIRDNIMYGIVNPTIYFGPGGDNLLFSSTYAPVAPNPTDVVGDPLFVGATSLRGADGLPFTADDGARLQAASPAIDAGAALPGLLDSDAYGTTRPVGGAWDIGPYERVAAPTTPPPASTPPTSTPPASTADDGGSSSRHCGIGGGAVALILALHALTVRRPRRPAHIPIRPCSPSSAVGGSRIPRVN